MQSKRSAALAALIDLAETVALGNTDADDLQRMAQEVLRTQASQVRADADPGMFVLVLQEHTTDGPSPLRILGATDDEAIARESIAAVAKKQLRGVIEEEGLAGSPDVESLVIRGDWPRLRVVSASDDFRWAEIFASPLPILHESIREQAQPDIAAVAEWVGLHYGRNFSAEPKDKQDEWIERYQEAHAEGEAAPGPTQASAQDEPKALPRVLVRVSGGVAHTSHDPGVRVFVFDEDLYDEDMYRHENMDEAPPEKVPASFADLARLNGIPFVGDDDDTDDVDAATTVPAQRPRG